MSSKSGSKTSNKKAPKLNHKENFIRRAKIIHNNKYTYDNVIYINSHKKVMITCQIHKDFPQEPRVHLDNKGCKQCGNLSMKHKITNKIRPLTNGFFEKSSKNIL